MLFKQSLTLAFVPSSPRAGQTAAAEDRRSRLRTRTRAEPTASSIPRRSCKWPVDTSADGSSVDAIDHSWLFPRIDAACHHGGAGTTGASLRAGIPTIIKPFFGDQMFWAERMESLGVGSAVKKLTSETLADALKAATTNERQIAKAKVVGESIRQEDGVQRAIESIYRDLEYAKSLIKPPPKSNNPLERIVSTSIHNIRSTRSSVIERTRSRHSREQSQSTDHGSDESWSVVSDSGQDSISESHSDSDDSHRGSKHSIGNIFGHLAHRLSRDKHEEF